jgi:hypothetical protein
MEVDVDVDRVSKMWSGCGNVCCRNVVGVKYVKCATKS